MGGGAAAWAAAEMNADWKGPPGQQRRQTLGVGLGIGQALGTVAGTAAGDQPCQRLVGAAEQAEIFQLAQYLGRLLATSLDIDQAGEHLAAGNSE